MWICKQWRVVIVGGLIPWRDWRDGRRHAQQLTAKIQFFFSVTIAEKAIVTDPLESFRQDMNEKSPNEFLGGQGHDLSPIMVAVILPIKPHSAIFAVD